MRAYLYVIVILMLIFGSIAGYVYNKFQQLSSIDFTPPPVTVAAGTARAEIWPSLLEAVGTIKATRGVELSTQTSGEVIAISVNSGDSVDAGQLLLTLNDSVEQASQRRQQAGVVLAQQLYDRDARLIRQKSIPQSQLDRSLADLDSASAQLAETRARLDNKRITAPFAGTVGLIHVKVGDYIEPGTGIATLQDLSELEVDFSVPAKYSPLLYKGLNIALTTAAHPEQTFGATLTATDSRVDASTRNLALRAHMNETQGLLPGMFVRLVIDLNQPTDTIVVAETAITYSLHGSTVYVIEQVGKRLRVQPRVVEVGRSRGNQTAVISGLAEGERVVTAGQNKLFRGAHILVDEADLLSQ